MQREEESPGGSASRSCSPRDGRLRRTDSEEPLRQTETLRPFWRTLVGTFIATFIENRKPVAVRHFDKGPGQGCDQAQAIRKWLDLRSPYALDVAFFLLRSGLTCAVPEAGAPPNHLPLIERSSATISPERIDCQSRFGARHT